MSNGDDVLDNWEEIDDTRVRILKCLSGSVADTSVDLFY